MSAGCGFPPDRGEKSAVDSVGTIQPKIWRKSVVATPLINDPRCRIPPKSDLFSRMGIISNAPVSIRTVGIVDHLPGQLHAGVHIPFAVVGWVSRRAVVQPALILLLVEGHRDIDLAQAVDAVGRFTLNLRLGQGGQQQGSQYRDDRDDNQQFNQCKCTEPPQQQLNPQILGTGKHPSFKFW